MSGVLTSGQGKTRNLRDNNGDEGEVQAFLNQVNDFLGAGYECFYPTNTCGLLYVLDFA
jgi:hypothetical protein